MPNPNDQVAAIFAHLREKLTPVLMQLPLIVGNEAVNYSLDAFKNQAWEGQAWLPVKNKKKGNRSILVKSGRSRRSIRIISTTPNSVTIGTDVPYMRVHNNGEQISRAARSELFVRNRYTKGTKKGKFNKGTTEGRGLSFGAFKYSMPQRQFIGRTPKFEAAMRAVIKKELQKALK